MGLPPAPLQTPMAQCRASQQAGRRLGCFWDACRKFSIRRLGAEGGRNGPGRLSPCPGLKGPQCAWGPLYVWGPLCVWGLQCLQFAMFQVPSVCRVPRACKFPAGSPVGMGFAVCMGSPMSTVSPVPAGSRMWVTSHM